LPFSPFAALKPSLGNYVKIRWER